jgi:hypothetical protein
MLFMYMYNVENQFQISISQKNDIQRSFMSCLGWQRNDENYILCYNFLTMQSNVMKFFTP